MIYEDPTGWVLIVDSREDADGRVIIVKRRPIRTMMLFTTFTLPLLRGGSLSEIPSMGRRALRFEHETQEFMA